MNGQLSEQPLGELIREISGKSLAGRLQLQHDRAKVLVYFDKGELLYAASNVRGLRLREYLLKAGIHEAALDRYDQNRSDIQLAKMLTADYVLLPAAAEQIQTKLVTDILRVALAWTEGAWEFDPRSRLEETPKLKVDTNALLLDAGRRGLSGGEHGSNVLGGQPAGVEPMVERAAAPVPAPAAEEKTADEQQGLDVESFLERLNSAQTHYDVLGVSKESSPAHMKSKYYELARRYHPDRFRKAEPSLLARTESAFARITQAYDTLRDDDLRANYDAKLAARRKAQQLADATTKPATSAAPPAPATPEGPSEAGVSVAERAELQFKEGLEALELGQRRVAVGLFASAANAAPKEARYRAFYGRLLAEQEHTRRAAEIELLAAIKLDPANGEYRVMLAELYRDLGLMLRARGEAERAIASDPNNRKAKDLLRALKSV